MLSSFIVIFRPRVIAEPVSLETIQLGKMGKMLNTGLALSSEYCESNLTVTILIDCTICISLTMTFAAYYFPCTYDYYKQENVPNESPNGCIIMYDYCTVCSKSNKSKFDNVRR